MTAQSRSDQNASTDHGVVVAAMVAVARDVRSLTVDPVTHAHLKRFVTLKPRIISYDHIKTTYTVVSLRLSPLQYSTDCPLEKFRTDFSLNVQLRNLAHKNGSLE